MLYKHGIMVGGRVLWYVLGLIIKEGSFVCPTGFMDLEFSD